jgi:hypothetical protein
MKLFWEGGSCAIGIDVLLEEAGLPYATEQLDIASRETRQPAFQVINPKRKVSTLVRNDGLVLTEFSAIAIWMLVLPAVRRVRQAWGEARIFNRLRPAFQGEGPLSGQIGRELVRGSLRERLLQIVEEGRHARAQQPACRIERPEPDLRAVHIAPVHECAIGEIMTHERDGKPPRTHAHPHSVADHDERRQAQNRTNCDL